MTLLLGGGACLCAAAALLAASADFTETTYAARRLFGLWRLRHVAPVIVLVLVGVGLLMAATSRHRLLSYLATTGTTIALFGLLELGGAVGLIPWSSLMRANSDELGGLSVDLSPNVDVVGTSFQDTAVIWGLPSDPVPFHFRTDRYGFRNHPDRAAADVDIILLGDSILVAALVPFDRTIGAQLEAATGRPVMQVALSAISPQREHELFDLLEADVRGKTVAQFIFEGNDLVDSRIYGERGLQQQPQPGDDSLLRQMWDLLVVSTDDLGGTEGLRLCDIDGSTYTFLWGRRSFEGLETEQQVIADSLERFALRIRSEGGRYLVVFVPDKLRVLAPFCNFPPDGGIKDAAGELGPFRDFVSQWAERTRIPLLDLTEPLIDSAGQGEIPWFWGDTHMNEIGQSVAAQALRSCLAAGSLTPDCGSGR